MATKEPAYRAHIRPLRMRLLLLAASGMLPLLLVLAWGIDHLFDESQASAERLVLELSRALATAVDAELRSTVSLLEHISTSDELERADLRSFHQSAGRTAEQLGWRQVVLADADGRVLLRTNWPYGEADPAPTEKESLAQVINTLSPMVGSVVTVGQRIDTFAVRVPVVRGGKLIYVLSAVLPTDKINTVLVRQNIPTGTLASVFDRATHRVARSRQLVPPYPAPSLKALLERGGDQGTGRTLTYEGIDNYSGFTRLKDWGWTVAVGTSVAGVREGVYSLLKAVAVGLAGSLALAVSLAWVLSRRLLEPIEALKDGAAALGRGDPVVLPPLDIVELDGVAVALAAAAQDRDRAAAQVNDALRVAEEANRSKDQFMAMLGHELRNPLAPIATAVRLMALKGDEKTAQERHVIERQLVHVTRLVDDLLDVSRITSGRLTIRREPVNVAQVLGQLVEAIQPSLNQRTVTLSLAPGADGAWVAGDEVRLAQVFNNLLVNAVKFTPPGQSISIRAAVEGPDVVIDVEDTGAGISESELEHIFELFYQGPQSPDRARGGLGLGLPIVRSLVGMHGGEVHATSGGVGQGSRFTVRLPLCEPPPAGEVAGAPAAAQGAGRILVVDDNEDAADTCATLLEMSGYDVRVAYKPETALEALREFTPDLAILDIGLPGMSGYELAARMKAPGPAYRGRLMALTGYGQASDLAASKLAGFDAHVTKPVAPAQLLDLIEKLLTTSGDSPS